MDEANDIVSGSIKSFAPDDFLRALGAALLAWQVVEDATFKLFRALLRNNDPSVSASIFFTPEVFGMKLKLVDNLARAVLRAQPELLSDWSTLRGAIETAAGHRNQMAHRGMGTGFDPQTGEMDLALMRSLYRPAAKAKKDHQMYNTPRLAQLHNEFGQLSFQIDGFRDRVDELN